jgi:hypothetical protein
MSFYLEKIGETYYFRLRVPIGLTQYMGCRFSSFTRRVSFDGLYNSKYTTQYQLGT